MVAPFNVPHWSLTSHSCDCPLDWPLSHLSSNQTILSNVPVWFESTVSRHQCIPCALTSKICLVYGSKGWDLKPQNVWAKCFSCTISHLMSYQPIKLRKINISILVWQMRMVIQNFPFLYIIHPTEDKKWLVIGSGIQTHFYHLTDSGILGLLLKIPSLCFFVCQVRLKRKIIYLTRLLWVLHKVNSHKALRKGPGTK